MSRKKETHKSALYKVSMTLAPGKAVLSSKEDKHWHPKKRGI